MDNNTLHADVVVIGFGKGGKIAAATLGRLGRRVVLIERSDQMYGGTCPNVGCVPTKALVHHSGNRRPDDSPQEWFEHAVGQVQALTSLFRAGNYDALNGADTITVITGAAAFVDSHTVAVGKGADRITVTAETILINTGSAPVIAGIPGLADSSRLVTNVDLIKNTTLPGRLAVIGGGYLGIEFASIYHRFGSRVTVFETSARILGREDDDVAAAAEQILTDEGVDIVPGSTVLEVRDGANETTVVYEKNGRQHTLVVDAVLAATGRAPVTDGLDLEKAGIRTTPRGAIEVDEYLRTSQPHVFALGDVNGGPQFTYISLDDSRIVLDQLTGEGKRTTTDRVAVPATLFMTPPLATIGLTEKQARAAGHRITLARQNVADIVAMPRAYIVEETRGLMKFVIDADTDQILGAALLSVDAQELINTVALAMRHGITASELRDSIYTHPSSTEAFNDVIGAVIHTDDPLDV
ncbi:pyruvate/2-oxoglutarate dehydrogenase complex dihydrolipoamide dehydrogenase (E3) component [Kribbella orskensis]|uniref:Pyruvate/2-oxoglutarate dehydrogenase complex dihydrolipoamide dehydrogenase (E3) component n=1 Tax=Kribbella orskensis TaxID=2512216 RepID=A0ABY2B7S9_9ACTN|nr:MULTISPECIES: FAD-dependent oxidoreductase [Kribbella]TCN29668.1 pyruvate/2-oxoglutarate dehydrogenase complex dihydrolipoamide dehydrogenase (E3) component [Kribbella sp. VKM Ac-2500]TCO10057.1 pyruvate/2-oxoglutarate dehydrogenase complex dihydrolipoamide dehydrogenase (E3) component [Kribbella orskensis]